MPDRNRYLRQIEAARDVGLTMTRTQLVEFIELLEEYADELAARVSVGLSTRGEAYALGLAREILQQLTRDMAASVGENIRITARRVAEIHAEAASSLIAGSNAAVTVSFGGIGTRAAQAVLARPALAASFRSIRRDSIEAVDQIIKRALLRGAQRKGLAMELRLHMLGADALPERLLLDRRRIGYDAIRSLGYEPTRENLEAVRKQAGQIADKARLIARTEPMVAEHEAAVRSAIESPVVAAIQWRLSGRHVHTDACDVLAKADLYGLGPGRYDVRHVPVRPHPRCTCPLTHVLRPVREWGTARGRAPSIHVDIAAIADSYELSPSKIDQLVAALRAGDRRMRRAA